MIRARGMISTCQLLHSSPRGCRLSTGKTMSSSFVFQSPEGCEFPMKFQRPQLAGLVSQFEKEVGHGQAVPPAEHRILVADQNVRIVGWQVQKRRDGARRLTFKVELPDQGQTVTLPCVLIPEDVQLTSDLCQTSRTNERHPPRA